MFWNNSTPVSRLNAEVDEAYTQRVRLDTQVAETEFALSRLKAERDRAVLVFDNLYDLLTKRVVSEK